MKYAACAAEHTEDDDASDHAGEEIVATASAGLVVVQLLPRLIHTSALTRLAVFAARRHGTSLAPRMRRAGSILFTGGSAAKRRGSRVAARD